jgi:hypothetical protein
MRHITPNRFWSVVLLDCFYHQLPQSTTEKRGFLRYVDLLLCYCCSELGVLSRRERRATRRFTRRGRGGSPETFTGRERSGLRRAQTNLRDSPGNRSAYQTSASQRHAKGGMEISLGSALPFTGDAREYSCEIPVPQFLPLIFVRAQGHQRVLGPPEHMSAKKPEWRYSLDMTTYVSYTLSA